MRRLPALALVVLAVAGCGSKSHASKLFTSAKQTGEAPAGPLAGGPASLRASGGTVTGKNLLVVRVRGDSLIVRNPRGGTLTVTHRHPAGATAVARPGDHVSFKGTRRGDTVTAGTLAVIHTG
jgi:hypothetical protein